MGEGASRLEVMAARVLDAGRSAYPELGVATDVVRRHLADFRDGDDDLDDEHLAHVYLAAALAARGPEALQLFERDHLPGAVKSASHLLSSSIRADDLRQAIRRRLFVAPPGGRPRIATYAGRGPFAGWLRVVAVREALELRRAREIAPGDDEELLVLASPGDDPELEYLRTRFSREFKEAFHEALASLDAESRNLLRLQLVEGLTIDELAEMFRIHRATAARRLVKAREATCEATRATLLTRLRLTESECTSIMGLLMSQLDVSLLRVLSLPTGSDPS